MVETHASRAGSWWSTRAPAAGNRSTLVREQNVAGSAVSLFRRELFERGFEYDPEFPSYEDWYLFRQLHDAGL